MSLKHKKVSGLPNVDANHIGGADWDDSHQYTAGTPFIAGRFTAFSDGTLTTSQSPTFLSFSKFQAGGYSLVIDPSLLPVAQNATLLYSGIVSISPLPLPTGWSFSYYAADGEVMFQFLNNGNAADPAFVWRVEGVLFAEVL